MIKIDYLPNADLTLYNRFILNFRSKLERYVRNQMIKYKNQFYSLDGETIRFFQWLIDGDNLQKLSNCKADQLEEKSNELKRDYHGLSDFQSNIFRLTRIAFDYLGYEDSSFPTKEIFKAIGITTCPYCNRAFIGLIENTDGTYTKGQLDHFFPRNLYPYFSISRYNLVPSCSECNGTGGKYKRSPLDLNLVSPYTLQDNQGIHFSMQITNKGFTNMKSCADAITIKVEERNDSGLEGNIRSLHLREKYNMHKDYASEIYFKGILRLSQKYRVKTRELLGHQGVQIDDNDFYRLLLGGYTNSDEFYKRPLSKFKYDLAKDMRLI